MKLTTGLANYCLDSGFNTAFDTTGILEARSGAAPTNAGDALTGTVLATISMAAAAFGAASSATVTAASVPWTDASADAGGTIGYVVARLSGDVTTADDTVRRALFTVGVGSGEFSFDSLAVAITQQVSITSLVITQPLT